MADQFDYFSYKMLVRKLLCSFVMTTFILTGLVPPTYAQTIFNLPQPGEMIGLSGIYTPVVLKGVSIHPEDPLLFDFIVDKGNSDLKGQALTDETTKLVKYFLTGLAVPEKELWVNLSPVEKNRIMADQLSHTDAGRDMLAQDYILKQVTSTLMYPEKDLGRKFWDEIYSRVNAKFGNTEVPVDTFNKVWITPDVAEVYQHNGNAFVTKAHLKVMLEADYNAAQGIAAPVAAAGDPQTIELTRDVVREVILPVLEKEVNEGKNFAALRQIFNSLILAGWYRHALKDSLLNQVYGESNKVDGIDIPEKNAREQVYTQYLQAYQKGVYNYIKDEFDSTTRETLPRKYFSGGAVFDAAMRPDVKTNLGPENDLFKKLGSLIRLPYKLLVNQAGNHIKSINGINFSTLPELTADENNKLLQALSAPLGASRFLNLSLVTKVLAGGMIITSVGLWLNAVTGNHFGELPINKDLFVKGVYSGGEALGLYFIVATIFRAAAINVIKDQSAGLYYKFRALAFLKTMGQEDTLSKIATDPKSYNLKDDAYPVTQVAKLLSKDAAQEANNVDPLLKEELLKKISFMQQPVPSEYIDELAAIAQALLENPGFRMAGTEFPVRGALSAFEQIASDKKESPSEWRASLNDVLKAVRSSQVSAKNATLDIRDIIDAQHLQTMVEKGLSAFGIENYSGMTSKAKSEQPGRFVSNSQFAALAFLVLDPRVKDQALGFFKGWSNDKQQVLDKGKEAFNVKKVLRDRNNVALMKVAVFSPSQKNELYAKFSATVEADYAQRNILKEMYLTDLIDGRIVKMLIENFGKKDRAPIELEALRDAIQDQVGFEGHPGNLSGNLELTAMIVELQKLVVARIAELEKSAVPDGSQATRDDIDKLVAPFGIQNFMNGFWRSFDTYSSSDTEGADLNKLRQLILKVIDVETGKNRGDALKMALDEFDSAQTTDFAALPTVELANGMPPEYLRLSAEILQQARNGFFTGVREAALQYKANARILRLALWLLIEHSWDVHTNAATDIYQQEALNQFPDLHKVSRDSVPEKDWDIMLAMDWITEAGEITSDFLLLADTEVVHLEGVADAELVEVRGMLNEIVEKSRAAADPSLAYKKAHLSAEQKQEWTIIVEQEEYALLKEFVIRMKATKDFQAFLEINRVANFRPDQKERLLNVLNELITSKVKSIKIRKDLFVSFQTQVQDLWVDNKPNVSRSEVKGSDGQDKAEAKDIQGGIDLGQGDYLKVVWTDAAGMPTFDPAEILQLQKDLRGIVPVPMSGPQPVDLKPLLGSDPKSGNDDLQTGQLQPMKVGAEGPVQS